MNMSFLSQIFRKKRKTSLDDDLSGDLARQNSLQLRQNEAEITRLRHRQKVLHQERLIAELESEVAHLRGEDEEDDEGGGSGNFLENKLLEIILGRITPAQPQNQIGDLTSYQSPEEKLIHLSDEEILKIRSKVPKKFLKIARNMPDQALKALILKQANVDDDTLQRAIMILREK